MLRMCSIIHIATFKESLDANERREMYDANKIIIITRCEERQEDNKRKMSSQRIKT